MRIYGLGVDAAIHARLDANAGADGLRLRPTAFAGQHAIEDREKKVDTMYIHRDAFLRESPEKFRYRGNRELVCPGVRGTCARLAPRRRA